MRLDDPLASANHALLTWRADGWWLRDLGSRNGTFYNEQRVEPGKPVVVVEGGRLRFGGQRVLCLISAGPPGPAGVRLSDATATDAVGGLLVLPDEGDPMAVVYAGHDGAWVIEQGDTQEALTGARRLLLGGALWLVLPPSAAGGPVPTTLALSRRADVAGMALHFRVSQDEEHVDVEVRIRDRVIPLRPRVHHFLLLQLARTRLDDRAQGTAEAEQGWVYVDDICKQLGVAVPVMNVQLLRARQQLAKGGVENAGQLFERRRLSGQLRLACRNIEVSKP